MCVTFPVAVLGWFRRSFGVFRSDCFGATDVQAVGCWVDVVEDVLGGWCRSPEFVVVARDLLLFGSDRSDLGWLVRNMFGCLVLDDHRMAAGEDHWVAGAKDRWVLLVVNRIFGWLVPKIVGAKDSWVLLVVRRITGWLVPKIVGCCWW